MKPAVFEYRRPATVADALADLARADGARVLAGGQSLVPLLNLRLATPPVVVDINRVEGLDEIVERDGRVHLGATVRQAAALTSDLVRTALPLVVLALTRVAHPQVRARGTVVGNLCHHDPASEMPAVAVALDAEFTVAAPDGSLSIVPAADFFLESFAVAVPPGGLVTGVSFPVAAAGTGAGFYEITRKAKDFALIAAAVQLTVTGGAVTTARVAVSGLTHQPVRMAAVEAALTGGPATPDAVRDAARLARADVLAEVNTRSPADYRSRVLPVVVARACRAAASEVAP
ncbi:FAD binding domain-containing protein [Modestobacter versicolor]|uniref:FAD binding domain-containing protein n=1 Tax=Modestobacter versicolor TaxID=429133 RepID=UPI0034DFBED5